MKSQQLVSAMMMTLSPSTSAKTSHIISEEIASILILTAAQKHQILNDPTLVTKDVIPDDLENYK
jgi:hypothetical protein